jgi:hypothetical protein
MRRLPVKASDSGFVRQSIVNQAFNNLTTTGPVFLKYYLLLDEPKLFSSILSGQL